MNWMGTACPFTIQNLIKICISKMMALCNTLDIWWWLWQLVHLNLVLFFSLACFIFAFDQTLVEHLYCDKGLLCQWKCENIEPFQRIKFHFLEHLIIFFSYNLTIKQNKEIEKLLKSWIFSEFRFYLWILIQ